MVCVFQFGDPQAGNQMPLKRPVVFGAGERITFGDTAILGLASKDGTTETSIFHEAVKEGLMDHPVFTTFLTKCAQEMCADGGVITFGDEDREHCQPVAKWVNIASNNGHWEFPMEGVSVNGQFYPTRLNGVSDTGTSHIIVPSSIFRSIIAQIRPQQISVS